MAAESTQVDVNFFFFSRELYTFFLQKVDKKLKNCKEHFPEYCERKNNTNLTFFCSRIVLAPFFYVGFADFWLADQLNSLGQAVKDFKYLGRERGHS